MAEAYCATLTEAGVALRVNKGGGFTVRYRLATAVRAPDVPMICSGKKPAVAVLFAVNVSWLDPVVALGENTAVRPPGSGVAGLMARLTLDLNPFCGVTVTTSLTELPCKAVGALWATAIVNEGVAFAVTVSGNVFSVPSSVPSASTPAMVVPVGAELLAVNVSVLDWPSGIVAGLKVAVTPVGSSGAERRIVSVGLLGETPATVTVVVKVPPSAIVDGYGDIFR